MAGPGSDPSDDEANRGGDHTAAFGTFEESPEEGADAGSADADEERPKGLLTILAVVVSIGLGLAVGFLARGATNVDLTTGDVLLLAGMAALVALAGLIAVRWGWWVTAGVTMAVFSLIIYNLGFRPEETIFGGSDLVDLARTVIDPAIGVVFGYLLQGLYSWIIRE